MSQASRFRCGCAPTDRVRGGQRYKVPVKEDVIDAAARKMYRGLMRGTSVSFGGGLSVHELAHAPLHVLSGLVPDGECKPFQWHALHPDTTLPLEMKIQWPNHGPETHFAGRLPLKVASGADVSVAELARWVAQAVQTVIDRCRASYAGRANAHCCWRVGLDNDAAGLTARDVYVVSLRHVEGCTYVPELEAVPARAPVALPTFVHGAETRWGMEREAEAARFAARRRRLREVRAGVARAARAAEEVEAAARARAAECRRLDRMQREWFVEEGGEETYGVMRSLAG